MGWSDPQAPVTGWILVLVCSWLFTMLESNTEISSLCFSTLTPPGPVYLLEPLQVYMPYWQLQSFTNCAYFLLRKMYSECSFSYFVPALWYTPPKVIRLSPSVSSFRSALKTPLFQHDTLTGMRENERGGRRERDELITNVCLTWYVCGNCVFCISCKCC